jgi:hypothetical protein
MIPNYLKSTPGQDYYCLLGIIVNRGRGRKVLQLARKMGFNKANCLLAEGRGASVNRLLELLALSETAQEIVMLIVKKEDEANTLYRFNEEFHFDKPHNGIAFTIPVCRPAEPECAYEPETPYVIVSTILNENRTDDFSDFVQKHGYWGLTTVKARGAASVTHPLMDMKVESAKSVMVMVVHRDRMDHLVELVTERFNLASENTGVLAVYPLSKVVGLPPSKEEERASAGSTSFTAAKEMVVALVPHGCAEDYLQHISKLGVSGSTIVHSRLINFSHEAESLLSFTADAEEEMVITLANHPLAQEIHQYLSMLTFENQIEQPYTVSLPVIKTKGVREEGE